jgi:hypothetical protein
MKFCRFFMTFLMDGAVDNIRLVIPVYSSMKPEIFISGFMRLWNLSNILVVGKQNSTYFNGAVAIAWRKASGFKVDYYNGVVSHITKDSLSFRTLRIGSIFYLSDRLTAQLSCLSN